MIFNKEAKLYDVEVERVQGENVMYVNYLNAPFVPSIADSPAIMSRTVSALLDNSNVSRIIFVQQRNYNYNSEQVLFLNEIASMYNYLLRQDQLLSAVKLSVYGNVSEVYADINYFLTLLIQDPISCYSELRKRINELREQREGGQVINKSGLVNYSRLLEKIFNLLENTNLIKKAKEYLSSYSFGDRGIYKNIFRPDILPNFTFTRLVAQFPSDGELVDQYELNHEEDAITVTILKRENDPKYFYHVMPPEYSINEEQHMLLNLARGVLTEHRPKAEQFTDSERTRQVFFNVSRDLLLELSRSKGINLNYRELNRLARILVRHTIGFGLI